MKQYVKTATLNTAKQYIVQRALKKAICGRFRLNDCTKKPTNSHAFYDLFLIQCRWQIPLVAKDKNWNSFKLRFC